MYKLLLQRDIYGLGTGRDKKSERESVYHNR